MPFQTYNDGAILYASQLNADNQTSLDLNTGTPQTIVSPIIINGGLTTNNMTATGTRTFSGGVNEQITTINSGTTYAVAVGDRFIMCNTGGALTINLPSSPATGRLLSIKDSRGTASSGTAITINAGALRIDGLASYPITTPYGRINLIYTGNAWAIID